MVLKGYENLMYFNIAVLSLLFVISGFVEFSVFNEEFLLLLCFLAFFVNTYCLLGSSTYKFFVDQVSAIRVVSFGAFDANIYQCSSKVTLASSKIGCLWMFQMSFNMFTKSLVKYCSWFSINFSSTLTQISLAGNVQAPWSKIFDENLTVFMLRLTFLT